MSGAPLLCIVGPTAVGKTALAIDIARRHGGEIVGVDASQIYRGMDIGTGKATAEELDGVTHHLIDVVDPDTPFDAARFMALADEAIADIRGRGRRPVLCGGTGLYLRALVQGLCEAPPVDPAVRAEIVARIEAGELPALHRELAAADPEAGARIAPADRQRIERALGVYLSSGKALSVWQAEHRAAPRRYATAILGLELPRPALNERIEARARGMFRGGLVSEVAQLEAQGYGPALRSMSAIGYRYALAVHAGEMSAPQAIELTARDTRRYAKRQMTWFRALGEITWTRPPVDDRWLETWLRAHWLNTGEA